MDYVDWVGRVFEGMNKAWFVGDDASKHALGVPFQLIGTELGFNPTELKRFVRGMPLERPAAVLDALLELVDLGIVERQENGWNYKWTAKGEEISQVGISVLWSKIVTENVEPEDVLVLDKLADICQLKYEDYAVLKPMLLSDVVRVIARDQGQVQRVEAYDALTRLAKLGMAKFIRRSDAREVQPTYKGLVRLAVARPEIEQSNTEVGEPPPSAIQEQAGEKKQSNGHTTQVITMKPVLWLDPEEVDRGEKFYHVEPGEPGYEEQQARTERVFRWGKVITEGTHTQLPEPLVNTLLEHRFFLNTSVDKFREWLAQTASPPSRRFRLGSSTERKWLLVQIGQLKEWSMGLNVVVLAIEGVYLAVTNKGELKTEEVGPVVSFKVITLTRERIEVQARCTSAVLLDYYRDLIATIGDTWQVPELKDVNRLGSKHIEVEKVEEPIRPSSADMSTASPVLSHSRTFRVGSILVLAVFIMWFLFMPSFEPLVGLVTSIITIAGLIKLTPTQDRWVAFGMLVFVELAVVLITFGVVKSQSDGNNIIDQSLTPTAVSATPSGVVASSTTTPTLDFSSTKLGSILEVGETWRDVDSELKLARIQFYPDTDIQPMAVPAFCLMTFQTMGYTSDMEATFSLGNFSAIDTYGSPLSVGVLHFPSGIPGNDNTMRPVLIGDCPTENWTLSIGEPVALIFEKCGVTPIPHTIAVPLNKFVTEVIVTISGVNNIREARWRIRIPVQQR